MNEPKDWDENYCGGEVDLFVLRVIDDSDWAVNGEIKNKLILICGEDQADDPECYGDRDKYEIVAKTNDYKKALALCKFIFKEEGPEDTWNSPKEMLSELMSTGDEYMTYDSEGLSEKIDKWLEKQNYWR